MDPPTVSENTPAAGTPFTLNATVRNQGNGASGATTLRYYQSDDPTITTTDTAIGTNPLPALDASQATSESLSLTAPDTPGTYHYGACADAVPGETDTNNNCSAAVKVTVTTPDLAVGPPTVSENTPAAGTPFTLNATVRNQGDRASGATTLRYYQSSDSTISTADTSVGTDTVGRLRVSEDDAESIRLIAPDTPGTYHYGACADAVPGEVEIGNNCSAAVAVTVVPARAPDLVVDTPTIGTGGTTTGAVPVGATVRATARVRNQGNSASGTTVVRYYRSADATITSSDALVVSVLDSNGVSPSGTGDFLTFFTVPTTVGTYYYGACVDPVGGESDTTNNCSAAVKVTVGAPDLVVESPGASDFVDHLGLSRSVAIAGAGFKLGATVRNTGTAVSGPSTLRYFRSTDATITTSDTAVGRYVGAVAYLSAPGSSDHSIRLTVPTTAGTYYYGACVDPVGGESDTTNNCSAAVAVTVTAPDLAVDEPTVSESNPTTGESFVLKATVRNGGNGSSGATHVRFYRSTDSTIGSSDTPVGTDTRGSLSLDPAGATTRSVSLTAPSTAGTYYYGACVDPVGGESDTTNNCSAAVKVTVDTTSARDFAVGTPTVGTSIQTVGETFRIVVSVRNVSDATSESATLTFYRSTDSTITTSDERIDSGNVGALGPSETAYLYTDPRAPSTPGTYYYGACVVSTGGESNTADNCSPALTIVAGRPDLVLDPLTVSPDSPETGSEIELRVDALHNRGDSWSGLITLRYYLSADDVITSADRELTHDLIAPLVPSSSDDIGKLALQAPPAPGTYYYGVCVDAVTGEDNTGNNCSVTAAVTVRLPNLLILTPTVSDSTPVAGTDFTLHATVVNRGSSRSQPTSLVYYRSTDKTITTDDTWLGSEYVSGLEPHQVSNERVKLTAPTTAGTYHYGACLRVGSLDYCSEAVEVTAGDAQPSPFVLRTECFVFHEQHFVRFTVTARVPLTSLAVSTYMVEGRTNTRHLVRRVEVGDLAADHSYSTLTSRLFFAHMRRHLTTCTARVEGYASVRPGFDPPANIVPDPQPQPPPDQPPPGQPRVEPTPLVPTYEATLELFVDIHNFRLGQAIFLAHASCGYSGIPCPWQDHISWWSSLPSHIQGCVFTRCAGDD
ncbi:MAG: hypothetical protein OXS29_20130 [bacterium]|nr:hypothetical protein [bacterium]